MHPSLLRGRWLVGHVVVVVAVVAMVNLGMWQLGRLDERKGANAEVLAGTRTTVPLDTVASPADDDLGDARFRRVQVRGTFAAERELLVRFRTNNGLPGYDVVTPLLTGTGTGTGTAILVNRGWVPVEMGEQWPAPGTRPPSGTVTVTGLLRESEAADRFRPTQRDEPPLIVGAIVTPRLEERLDLDLYPGWLHLQEPDDPASFPEPLPDPDLSEGPHLTYAIQWFSFAAIGAVGWALLVASSLRAPEARRRRRAPAD